MAKINLKNMSPIEIVEYLSTNIRSDQLMFVVKNTSAFKKIIDCQRASSKQIDVNRFLMDYPEEIDTEKLALCIGMNILDFMGRTDFFSKDNLTENLDKCKRLLKNSKAEIPRLEQKNKRISVSHFFTVDDLFGNSKNNNELKQKNLRVINKLETDGVLNMMLTLLEPEDYKNEILYYPGNSEIFEYVVNYNAENRRKMFESSGIEKDFSLSEKNIFLSKHADKFDIDKLILTSVCKLKLISQNKNEDFNRITARIMKKTDECIQNPKSKISGRITNEKNTHITYSAKDLKADTERIVNGMYYSREDISEQKKQFLSGEKELGDSANIAYIQLLNFSFMQMKELIKINPKNLEYFVFSNMLKPEQIKECLEQIEKYKFDSMFIELLYTTEVIEKEDIINLYMKNNLDLTETLSLDENYDLKPEITVEKLMEYYKNSKKNLENEKDFARYSLLFREINLKNKDKEKQNYISEQLVEEIYKLDSEYSEDFKALYNSDLLPIRTLIDWNGEDIIYDLIKNKSLKPKDAKELLMSGELNLQKTYRVLANSDLSETDKINFIYSSFDGVGKTEDEIKAQTDARNYLIQAINVSKDFTNIEEGTHKHRERGEGGTKRKQYITDPIHRWQLFSKIDDECKAESYLDGTVIFTLPNIKKGTVVIEKLFKKTKDGNAINYGSATYAMSQEEFLNHKAEIVQNGKINRRVLIQMREEGTADRSVHSVSWGKDLKKNLGLSIESGYSEEKIAEIDNLVDRIEKARELVD